MTLSLDQAAICALIPHRFENVLIDQVTCTDAGSEATLTIHPGEPAGRDIFLRTDGPQPALIEHAIPEYLALASLCQLGDLGEGHVGFFSTISNFKQSGRLPAGEPANAALTRERDRGPFRRFKGKVANAQGTHVASADIMAFILDTTAGEAGQEERRRVPLPAMDEDRPLPAGAFWWKRPELCFVSHCLHLDLAKREATLGYVYPPDHPLTKGHFPGNPVMMGVTQWAAASDALDWLAFALINAGEASCPTEIKADVLLQKDDGTVVAEVGGVVNRYTRTDDGRVLPETVATKRIGFRDMVRPGEQVITSVSLSD